MLHEKPVKRQMSVTRLWRSGGLVVSTLDSASALRSHGCSSGRDNCVVFLGETLNSHSASKPKSMQISKGDLEAHI